MPAKSCLLSARLRPRVPRSARVSGLAIRMTSVLCSSPSAPMLTSLTIQATLPLHQREYRPENTSSGLAPPISRQSRLLFAQGVRDYEPLRRDRRARLEELRTGDGRCLPVHLKAQISRELDRLEIILVQLKAVESERDALLAKGNEDQPPTPASLLVQLKGIGPEFAAVLWSEGLFRSFNNRRQVAAYAGLAPTPWQSGSIDREQGVSKAGNSRLPTTMFQLTRLSPQHQPLPSLTISLPQLSHRTRRHLN